MVLSKSSRMTGSKQDGRGYFAGKPLLWPLTTDGFRLPGSQRLCAYHRGGLRPVSSPGPQTCPSSTRLRHGIPGPDQLLAGIRRGCDPKWQPAGRKSSGDEARGGFSNQASSQRAEVDGQFSWPSTSVACVTQLRVCLDPFALLAAAAG